MSSSCWACWCTMPMRSVHSARPTRRYRCSRYRHSRPGPTIRQCWGTLGQIPTVHRPEVASVLRTPTKKYWMISGSEYRTRVELNCSHWVTSPRKVSFRLDYRHSRWTLMAVILQRFPHWSHRRISIGEQEEVSMALNFRDLLQQILWMAVAGRGRRVNTRN